MSQTQPNRRVVDPRIRRGAAPPAAPPTEPETTWPDVLAAVQWTNLLSIRVWFSAIFTGFLLSIAAGLIWDVLAMPALAVGTFGMLAMYMATPIRCPECRKMVKLGGRRCSHCGTHVA